MKNSLALNDWYDLTRAMANPSYHETKIPEEPKFKLEVIREGNLHGIVIYNVSGGLIHEELHLDLCTGESFYHSSVLRKGEDQVSRLDWLGNHPIEIRDKFWETLRKDFFKRVIQGKSGGSIEWECEDFPTLHKWVSVLEIKP